MAIDNKHYNIWHILPQYLLPIWQDNIAVRRSLMKYKTSINSIKFQVMLFLVIWWKQNTFFPRLSIWQLTTCHLLGTNLYNVYKHNSDISKVVKFTLINIVVFSPSNGFQWFQQGQASLSMSPQVCLQCGGLRGHWHGRQVVHWLIRHPWKLQTNSESLQHQFVGA